MVLNCLNLLLEIRYLKNKNDDFRAAIIYIQSKLLLHITNVDYFVYFYYLLQTLSIVSKAALLGESMACRLVVAVTDRLSTLGVVLPQLSNTHTTFIILSKNEKINTNKF